MKHLLLATTALVATAGVAAADVNVSGYAEMGIVGGSDMETQWHDDYDVTFSMSGESDSGISFGAAVDLDENDAFTPSTQGGASAFVSFGGATFTMGDTDGAFDKAMTEVNVAGASIDDSETIHSGFNGNAGFDGLEIDGVVDYDGQIARLDYAFEGFTGSLSAEMDDDQVGDTIWGLGVAYNAELAGLDLGVGLGYQTTSIDGTDLSLMGISLSTTFANGLVAAINYSQADVEGLDDDPTHMGIGLGYSAGALAIGVNYGEYSDWILADAPDGSGFGLAATYDMGGGLAAHLGYGSSKADDDADSTDTWSLGLSMSF